MIDSQLAVVFFDAAGTLFHVNGSVADIYLRHAQRYGVKPSPAMQTAIAAAFRRALRDAPPPVFAATEPQEIKRCERLWWFDIVHHVFYRVGMFEGFDDYFEEVFQAFDGPGYWALYPETVPVLMGLKTQGLEIGIISNFDSRVFSVLRGLGLSAYFDTVTISSMARAAKPSVRIFESALAKHAVDPEEAIHVGDNVAEDVQGALSAGLRAVLLQRADARQTEPIPQGISVINSLDELPTLLGLR